MKKETLELRETRVDEKPMNGFILDSFDNMIFAENLEVLKQQIHQSLTLGVQGN
jgi:hypothetical protein